MGVERRGRLLEWSDDDEGGRRDGAAYREPQVGGGLLRVLLWDFVLSLLWVCTFASIKLSPGRGWPSMAIKYVIARFVFAFIMVAAGAGRFNPLSTFSSSLFGGSRVIWACLFGRIPAQVLGCVFGVWMVMRTFPEYIGGPRLDYGVVAGVAVQAIVGFAMVIVNCLLAETEQGLVVRTIFSSISILTLRGVTGGWVNPGTAFGWAYAKGLHMSMQHLLVYWISPFMGTLVGVHVYNSVVHPDRQTGNLATAIIRWKSD